jgi:hypothetical protein
MQERISPMCAQIIITKPILNMPLVPVASELLNKDLLQKLKHVIKASDNTFHGAPTKRTRQTYKL